MKHCVVIRGRAVVYEDDNPIYTLEVKHDDSGQIFVEVKPYEPGLHLGMWLQPAMNTCSSAACLEEVPFPLLQDFLIHWSLVEEFISLFVIFIDPSLSKELRQEAVAEFEHGLQTASDEVRTEIESVILEPTPSPSGMSTRDLSYTGLTAAIMDKFVAKHGHQPPA